MSDMCDYFEMFPDEDYANIAKGPDNPDNWVHGRFDPAMAQLVRGKKGEVAHQSANLRSEIDRMIAEANTKPTKGKK